MRGPGDRDQDVSQRRGLRTENVTWKTAVGMLRGPGYDCAPVGSGRVGEWAPDAIAPFPRCCGADAAAPRHHVPPATGSPFGPGASPGPTPLPARTRDAVEPVGAVSVSRLARPAGGALPLAGAPGVDSVRGGAGEADRRGDGLGKKERPLNPHQNLLCVQVAEGQELKDKRRLLYPINGAWGLGPCAQELRGCGGGGGAPGLEGRPMEVSPRLSAQDRHRGVHWPSPHPSFLHSYYSIGCDSVHQRSGRGDPPKAKVSA